jgi:hypothetical protein
MPRVVDQRSARGDCELEEPGCRWFPAYHRCGQARQHTCSKGTVRQKQQGIKDDSVHSSVIPRVQIDQISPDHGGVEFRGSVHHKRWSLGFVVEFAMADPSIVRRNTSNLTVSGSWIVQANCRVRGSIDLATEDGQGNFKLQAGLVTLGAAPGLAQLSSLQKILA